MSLIIDDFRKKFDLPKRAHAFTINSKQNANGSINVALHFIDALALFNQYELRTCSIEHYAKLIPLTVTIDQNIKQKYPLFCKNVLLNNYNRIFDVDYNSVIEHPTSRNFKFDAIREFLCYVALDLDNITTKTIKDKYDDDYVVISTCQLFPNYWKYKGAIPILQVSYVSLCEEHLDLRKKTDSMINFTIINRYSSLPSPFYSDIKNNCSKSSLIKGIYLYDMIKLFINFNLNLIIVGMLCGNINILCFSRDNTHDNFEANQFATILRELLMEFNTWIDDFTKMLN